MLNVSLIKSYQETNNEKYFNDSREHADPIKDVSMTHEPVKKKNKWEIRNMVLLL